MPDARSEGFLYRRLAAALRSQIEAWAEHSGALEIHAFDQAETLLGQGTVGLELEEQAAHLDTLLVAVGGGGLLGGIASWYAGRIRLIGVEPEEAPTLTSALAAGRPVDARAGGIAADSLAPKRVGELMFPIEQRHVDRVVLVRDDEIRAAQRMLWDRLRIVTEPGGAAAFAALVSARYQPSPRERLGVLLCGGNTTVELTAAAPAVLKSRGSTCNARNQSSRHPRTPPSKSGHDRPAKL